MTDLLWADPQDEQGRGMSKRGTSMQFGPDVTEKFCKDNKLGVFSFLVAQIRLFGIDYRMQIQSRLRW